VCGAVCAACWGQMDAMQVLHHHIDYRGCMLCAVVKLSVLANHICSRIDYVACILNFVYLHVYVVRISDRQIIQELGAPT
jgi:hypothetical protein